MLGTLRNCALVALVLIVAPTTAAFAKHTQTYKLLHPSEPPVAAGLSRIYLYRESGFMGAAVSPDVMIDGTPTGGEAHQGTYFYIDRAPGTYIISTSTEKDESTSVTVAAGQPLYVKLPISMGLFVGHVIPEVVDPAIAASEIEDCDLREPANAAPPSAPATPPAAPAATPAAPAAPPAAPATPDTKP